MTVLERLRKLRARMLAESVDVLLMTSSDDHASEYVGDYYKVTEFFSGCTSDNVVLAVTAAQARLWTDGRFFISADAELAGSGILLMRMGEPGVPKVSEYLEETLKEGQTLAYDGRCVDAAAGLRYRETAAMICGVIGRDEAKELIKKNTRNYAKRQLTWFRRYDGIRILVDEGGAIRTADELAKEAIERI